MKVTETTNSDGGMEEKATTAKGKLKKAPAPSPAKFTKQQLVGSKKYGRYRDVLNAVLIDGKTYTHEQVEKKLETFLKGKVSK